MDSIEKIQYQAALVVTGAWQGSSRNKLYDELGWESLNDRRYFRRLVLIYKIHNNISPRYLIDNMPPLRRRLYGNIYSHIYHEIQCKTNRYMNSFFPDAIKIWNKIDTSFHQCNTIGSFKHSIIGLLRPTAKSIFNVHDPVSLKFLFQLRVSLSPLKQHKLLHGFDDIINDWCACNCSPESTTHFLFYCPLYDQQRIVLFNSVNRVIANSPAINIRENSKLLLYGHSSLNFDLNNFVFSIIC